MKSCRVCKTGSPVFFTDSRTFYKCPACTLIFTEEAADQKAAEDHYRGQWNTADDDFWERQVNALLVVIRRYLEPKRILDFGSGSGDITRGFKRKGFDITPLEPMTDGYLKDQDYPHKFDVVIGVEVIEHLPNLYEELEEIEKVLADGGIMVFSTGLTNQFVDAPTAADIFAKWWYKDDPTHVSFFNNRSIFEMARIAGCTTEIYGDQLFVMGKV